MRAQAHDQLDIIASRRLPVAVGNEAEIEVACKVFGEAAGRVSAEFTAAHPEIPWKSITGLRHKLIHDYFDVDLGIVWSTATTNVPEVLPVVRSALGSLGG